MLSDGNIPTLQRNRLSSLLGYVILLEMSGRFRKLLRFVIVVVEAADSPETTPHAYQSTRRQRPRVQQSSLSVLSLFFLTCSLSLSYCYHFPYVGLASVAAVCCFQQWIDDVSSSLSLVSSPHPAPQKKPTLTILAHTLEACPVLLGNSSPGGM